MDNEQVIKNLENQCWEVNSVCDCKGKECGNCHLATAIKAIEKQIPMKPKIVEHMDCCPVCGKEDGGCTESWHRPYCCSCGQALDWSDYDY